MPKNPLRNFRKNRGFRLDLQSDPEDSRDYTVQFKIGALPQHQRFDLKQYCTSIKDQGSSSSCVPFATVGAVEFMCKKYVMEHPNDNNHQAWFQDDFLSELFLYYFARTNPENLGGLGQPETYAGGMWPRNALQTLRLAGCCPEKMWPFVDKNYDLMPDVNAYNVAEQYQIRGYAKLPEVDPQTKITHMKMVIESGFPIISGFCVPKNYRDYKKDGIFRYTGSYDGGHAVLFVGFDDNMEAHGEKGFFIVKNSWGADWGDHGYCFVPYRYMLAGWMPYERWIVFSSEIGNIDQDPEEEVITTDIDPYASFTILNYGGSGATLIRPPFDQNKFNQSRKRHKVYTNDSNNNVNTKVKNFFLKVFPCLKK